MKTGPLGAAIAGLVLGVSAQQMSRSVWQGVYTTEQAKRGESLYARECASCHGDSLTGGEQVPPLAGGEFLADWDGLSAGDLFERIRKTMPMNKPGKLTPEVNADILAYVLAVNKFPSGDTELSHDAEMLKQIRIESTKPTERNKK